METLLVIFEIDGVRRGYRGNRYCCERFFKGLLYGTGKLTFITTYVLDTREVIL